MRDLAFKNAIESFNNGEFSDAIFWFKKALESPYFSGLNSDELILNNLATVYSKSGDHNNAKTYYEKAIKIGLRNDNIYFSLAATNIRLGNNSEALLIYNNLINQNPSNGKAFYLRGKLYQRMGDFFKGSEDLGKAAKLDYFG